MIADIVAQNAEGQIVLIAVVKGRVLEEDIIPEFFRYLKSESKPHPIPFGMVVDLESIYITAYKDGAPAGSPLRLKTADVVRRYDPEYGSKRVFGEYLATLILSWLEDLAYHWKSEVPPAAAEVAAIGLLEELAGGVVRREVPLGADSLR